MPAIGTAIGNHFGQGGIVEGIEHILAVDGRDLFAFQPLHALDFDDLAIVAVTFHAVDGV